MPNHHLTSMQYLQKTELIPNLIKRKLVCIRISIVYRIKFYLLILYYFFGALYMDESVGVHLQHFNV